jgi:membrane protease YdiL (CAAX protease family)
MTNAANDADMLKIKHTPITDEYFTVVGILVYTISGYNSFMDSTTRLSPPPLGTSPGSDFFTVIPWMLVFAFSNAFMEELIFRDVFLDKLKNLFGERLALVQTSLMFSIFHVSILETTGTEMIVAFTAFIMLLGLVWGYIVQESDTIWGFVLAHIVADVLVVSTILGLI